MRTSAHTTGCGNHLFRRGRSQRPCRNVRGPGPAQSTYTFNDVAGLGGFLRDYVKSLNRERLGPCMPRWIVRQKTASPLAV